MSLWFHQWLLMLYHIDFLNFINKCFIIWFIIHNFTIVKKWHYKQLRNCNKNLSWKFIEEVSEEPNAFINFAKFPFNVSIVIEFFFKIQPNMFLNGSLGGWYIIEIYGRTIFFWTLPRKITSWACFEGSELFSMYRPNH